MIDALLVVSSRAKGGLGLIMHWGEDAFGDDWEGSGDREPFGWTL